MLRELPQNTLEFLSGYLGLRHGLAVREIPLPKEDERGHPEGLEPLHGVPSDRDDAA